MNVSDGIYGRILAALQAYFAQPDSFIAGTFRDLAVSAMTEGLDEINRALVQRGLLPPFTLP